MSESFQNLFPQGGPNTVAGQYFSGASYLYPLSSEGGVSVANVTFEPACRNNWHIHHKGGQILLCTAGRGYYQEWGKPARELHPGDVVSIPPEVKHWHGAAPDSWFAHVAISVPGSQAEWLEPVADEDMAAIAALDTNTSSFFDHRDPAVVEMLSGLSRKV